MKEFLEYLPFVMPLLIIQLILMITAVIHVLKHPNYKFGNRIMWILIVVIVQIIGPAVYFIFGRSDEE